MRRVATYLVLALCVLTACQPSGPTFEVETWEGKKLKGALNLEGDTLSVGRRRLARADVALAVQETGEGARASGKYAEGCAPLSSAALAQYRDRARAFAARTPGIDSVLCLDHGQEVLTADGKHIYRYHALHLVLKEGGRKAADLQLGFEEGRSRQTVFFARSIAPDGRTQWFDPATLEVAVPSQEAQFLDTRGRVLSGRIPGVEVDSLVEYAYEYLNYNPDVPDYFFPSFYFQGDEPFLDSILDVLVPKGRKLNWTTRNMPEAARTPQRTSRGAYDAYRWAMHDVPPYCPEPMMPHKSDVVPAVHCSLFFDWDELHRRTGGYQRERVQVTPEIAALAAKIVGEAKTDDAKLAAIYHWVQRNVNYMSIKGSLSSSWAGHPATETLKNGYGDCTDKAIVLASLAKAVGIEAYPAIVQTNDAGRAVVDIPIPDANHCINLVLPNGKPRFLDSTATDHRYPYFRSDDHGVKAIIHMTGQILDVPVPPPEDNLRESVQELVLKPDGGADATERNTYTGDYEATIRAFWRSVPPGIRAHMMQQYLQRRSPGAVCTGFELGDADDLSKPLTMAVSYRIPSLATQTRDLYILSPPGFSHDFPEASLQTRQFAIERATTQEMRTTLQIVCPPRCTLVGAPEPLAIHGKHLWYEGRVEPAPDGKSLTLRQTLKYLTRLVPPEDYAEYRGQATKIAAWSELKLVFREGPGPRRAEK
ncbi:MAG TPA: DUF3857 domain-containing protein [Planctomycetota bacterium]|nr:DUF3857 domain-containing protein [Planctomycetota bacterium]HRT94737.1 DUF3857 domain-containing protein [Planctomycetota bacterium]